MILCVLITLIHRRYHHTHNITFHQWNSTFGVGCGALPSSIFALCVEQLYATDFSSPVMIYLRYFFFFRMIHSLLQLVPKDWNYFWLDSYLKLFTCRPTVVRCDTRPFFIYEAAFGQFKNRPVPATVSQTCVDIQPTLPLLVQWR